jgi:GT2 family glycosyltransferase
MSTTESPEIILVDNASTERDVDELKKDFPELIIIKNNENIGFAKANNSIFEKSTL